MIRVHIIVILVLFSISVDGQTVNWKLADQWKMFYNPSSKSIEFQSDSSRLYKSRSLDSDSMRYYLAEVALIPSDRSNGAVWMGDYWVSCQIQARSMHLRISRYGGFFEDVQTGIYYEIPMELRASWHLFLTHQLLALEQSYNN